MQYRAHGRTGPSKALRLIETGAVDTVRVMDGRGLPDGHREALRAHRWVRNFYR